MENIDLIFLFVIAAFIGYYFCKKEKFDSIEGFAAIDDARQAVREVYNADVDAIRNLSDVAKKLQAGGITVPGTLKITGGQTIEGQGRLHVSGPELLYILNKNGVVIGKEWGGNGNLHAQGVLSTDVHVNTPSLRRVGGDWLRINDGGIGRVALYGGLAINDTNNGNSGLSVGEWNDKVGQGNILATGTITARRDMNANGGILNLTNGWRIITNDGHFRIQHNGADKLVAHNGGSPVYAPNGMDVGTWRGTGGGTLNVSGNANVNGTTTLASDGGETIFGGNLVYGLDRRWVMTYKDAWPTVLRFIRQDHGKPNARFADLYMNQIPNQGIR